MGRPAAENARQTLSMVGLKPPTHFLGCMSTALFTAFIAGVQLSRLWSRYGAGRRRTACPPCSGCASVQWRGSWWSRAPCAGCCCTRMPPARACCGSTAWCALSMLKESSVAHRSLAAVQRALCRSTVLQPRHCSMVHAIAHPAFWCSVGLCQFGRYVMMSEGLDQSMSMQRGGLRLLMRWVTAFRLWRSPTWTRCCWRRARRWRRCRGTCWPTWRRCCSCATCSPQRQRKQTSWAAQRRGQRCAPPAAPRLSCHQVGGSPCNAVPFDSRASRSFDAMACLAPYSVPSPCYWPRPQCQ